MAEIINRVKNSSLITLDISNLYDNRDRVNLDFSKLLDNGILIEKQFRENLKNYDWSSLDGKYVFVTPKEDLIIPSWAYILLSYYLSKNCLDFVYGDIKNLNEKLYIKEIDKGDRRIILIDGEYCGTVARIPKESTRLFHFQHATKLSQLGRARELRLGPLATW